MNTTRKAPLIGPTGMTHGYCTPVVKIDDTETLTVDFADGGSVHSTERGEVVCEMTGSNGGTLPAYRYLISLGAPRQENISRLIEQLVERLVADIADDYSTVVDSRPLSDALHAAFDELVDY